MLREDNSCITDICVLFCHCRCISCQPLYCILDVHTFDCDVSAPGKAHIIVHNIALDGS